MLSIESFFPWSSELSADPQKVAGRAGQAMVELEGPSMKMTRSHLRLLPSGKEMAGQLMRGNGNPLSRVVDFASGEWTVFENSPKFCLNWGEGAFLVEDKGDLWKVAANGTREMVAKDRSGFLLDAGNGYFWSGSKDLQEAILQDLDGSTRKNYRFRSFGQPVCDGEGRLCFTGKVKNQPEGLKCLDQEGEWSVREEFDLSAFDQVLGLYNNQLVSTIAGGIRIQEPGGRDETIPLLSAGRTSDGEGFISGFSDGLCSLTIGGHPTMQLEIPNGKLTGMRPYYVVSVTKETILVRGDAWLLEYDATGKHKKSTRLDNATYESDLFPKMWQLHQISVRAKSKVFLSCSGPDGLVVIGMDLGS